MLSWYSLLAFSAWTWLFLPCTASTISLSWRTLKEPSFSFLAYGCAFLLCGIPKFCFHSWQRNKAPYLAHWHTAVAISQLSQISLCAFRLCWVTPIVISSCATLSYKILLFRFLWLLFQLIDIDSLIDIYCLFHESDFYCWIHLVWGMHSTKACTTAHSLDKRHRKLWSFYELCPHLWHSQADGGPSIFPVLSQIAPFWAVSFDVQFLRSFPACLPGHHFTHTLLPCKCAAASLLVAPSKCHTTNNILWNTLKCEVLGPWHPKFKEPEAHVHLWHHW